jgi:hypothetical protein
MPKRVNIKFYIIIGLLIFVIIYLSSFSSIEALKVRKGYKDTPLDHENKTLYYFRNKKVRKVKTYDDETSEEFYYLDKTRVDDSGNFILQITRLPIVSNILLEIPISNSQKPNPNYSVAVNSRDLVTRRLSVHDTNIRPYTFRDENAENNFPIGNLGAPSSLKILQDFWDKSDPLTKEEEKRLDIFWYTENRYLDPSIKKNIIFTRTDGGKYIQEVTLGKPGTILYNLDVDNVRAPWVVVHYFKKPRETKYYILKNMNTHSDNEYLFIGLREITSSSSPEPSS